MEKQTKTYQPTGNQRNNYLSKIPGGSTVTVHYEGYSVNYDNIKNTQAYIDKILQKNTKESIVSIVVEGQGTVFGQNR